MQGAESFLYFGYCSEGDGDFGMNKKRSVVDFTTQIIGWLHDRTEKSEEKSKPTTAQQ